MTCNLLTEILTKQLLKNAHSIMWKLALSTSNAIDTLLNEKKKVLDLNYISDAKPSAHLYKLIVNAKGKFYQKLRRRVKRYCNKLTTTHYI